MRVVMVGRLDPCFLLTYTLPSGQVAHLVPKGLELITYGRTAFFNVVACRVERMRPVLAPRALGVTYWHIAYRLQVRARLAGGDSIEGLYFLRSDVDRRLFGRIGNWLTDFRFHGAVVRFSERGTSSELRVEGTERGAGDAVLKVNRLEKDALASGSPFPSLEERERILKYSPYGLAVDDQARIVRIAEVVRDETRWKEEPVGVTEGEWMFFRSLGVGSTRLERATRVAPIDYRWRLGRKAKPAPS